VPPIAADGRVFANGEGSNAVAYGLRERDGKLVWTQYLTGAGLPSLGDGGLFLTSNCFYYRLSPSDGTLIWTHQECVGGGPDASEYMNKRLYILQYPAGDVVDTATGNVVGSYPTYGATPALFTLGLKELGVSQQSDTTIGCWNAKTGQLVWQFSAEFEIQAPPIVVNSVVYFVDGVANLYALNPKNGKKIWSDNVGDYGPSPMLSAGQDTLVVTNNSKVIAYRSQ
jgi:outer membrane protein assembly factor BamB